MRAASLETSDRKAIEQFCSEVREGLDNATFEDKLRYFDLLNLRAKLAIEKNKETGLDEQVAYVTCKLGKRRLSVVATSPLSSIGAITIPACECR